MGMSKYCQHCNVENPDDAFWCINCNTKILNNAIVKSQPPLNSIENDRVGSSSVQHHHGIFVFVSIVSVVIAIACLLVYTFLNGSVFAFGHHDDFLGIDSEINEDFWFEGQYLNTSSGWSFELTKVKEYTLQGRILALKTYHKNDIPYDPCNSFSPIDFFIGVDDVLTNTSNYVYSITSFDHRIVSWYLYNDDMGAYLYFKSHTGNNHIIPHTKEVLDALVHNVSTGVSVILNGSLVHLYGTNGNQIWRWTTDTSIGNYDCEIILVDEIKIIQSYG